MKRPWLSFKFVLRFSFDRTIWKKSRHNQFDAFDWMFPAHLTHLDH